MASRGINKVILVGNLGRDPEVRYMPNSNAVTTLSIATSESWRDKQTGEMKEQTEWHRVVLFGKLAEVASEYLRKGSQVYIEGQLRTRKWQDQHGRDRYSTEVVVNVNGSMQMLGVVSTRAAPPLNTGALNSRDGDNLSSLYQVVSRLRLGRRQPEALLPACRWILTTTSPLSGVVMALIA